MDSEAKATNLKEYQDLLFLLLEQEKDMQKIKSRLKSDSRFQSLEDYIEAMDPEMLEVAKELLSKWGKRS